MNIFEIDKEMSNILAECVDEDGCITDDAFERISELQQERDAKLENLACYIVNLSADAKAIREQEKLLAERRQKIERKTDKLKDFLKNALNGEKLANETRVCVSYRKTKSVETDEGFLPWAMANAPDLLTYSDPTVSKTAVKEYLKDHELDNARIVESVSMTVK